MDGMEDMIKFFVSKVLSYGVVFGAIILKVPQIVSILRSGSADGISLASVLIETVGFSISASWGIARDLDFKDYGENVFIIAQLLVLNLLVAAHYKKTFFTIVVMSLISVATWALSMGMVPLAAHQILLSSQTLLSMSSRVPQIYLNYKHRSTGQLSFATFFLAFGGGCARVLTTLVNVSWENGKSVLLVQFVTTACLNAVILFQIVFYTGIFAKKAPAATKQPAKGKKKSS